MSVNNSHDYGNGFASHTDDPAAYRRFMIEELRRRQLQRQQQGQSRQSASETPKPAAELSENESWMRLTVDLPGVFVQDLDVSVDNGVLSVQATRKTMSVDDSVCIKKQKICRRYAVDTDTIDISNMKANLAHGVLTIRAPKRIRRGYVRVNVDTDEQAFSNQFRPSSGKEQQTTGNTGTVSSVAINQQGASATMNVSDDEKSANRQHVRSVTNSGSSRELTLSPEQQNSTDSKEDSSYGTIER